MSGTVLEALALVWQCHDRSTAVVWHYGKAPLCGAELAEPCRTLTLDPKRTVTCPVCRRMMEQEGTAEGGST